jgi:hypothetical protein
MAFGGVREIYTVNLKLDCLAPKTNIHGVSVFFIPQFIIEINFISNLGNKKATF